MATEAAERDLVRKFNLQEVNPDVKLNLGKYGKVLVKDIFGMTRIEGPVPVQHRVDNISSIFGENPFK